MADNLLAAGLGKSRQVVGDGKSCPTKAILLKASKNPTRKRSLGNICRAWRKAPSSEGKRAPKPMALGELALMQNFILKLWGPAVFLIGTPVKKCKLRTQARRDNHKWYFLSCIFWEICFVLSGYPRLFALQISWCYSLKGLKLDMYYLQKSKLLIDNP